MSANYRKNFSTGAEKESLAEEDQLFMCRKRSTIYPALGNEAEIQDIDGPIENSV